MIQLTPNPNNPRTITKDKFEKLKKSIREFPKMLDLRPIIYDENLVILGGNMRYKALEELEREGFEIKDNWFLNVNDLTETQKKEFIVKDNVPFGDWDWDILANEWGELELENWGLDLPKNTERLSGLEFTDMYYKPEKVPDIDLTKCIDLDKYREKVKVIEEANISEDKKEILKMFAYRFIRIDFESIANYYYFNASEEEKKVIERLRLVLCDSGVNGFIEDHLLRVYEILGWEND